VRLDLKKLQPIKNWKRPIMVKGIWSLLGLANLYWTFTKDFVDGETTSWSPKKGIIF
jgi:hypothetical protein